MHNFVYHNPVKVLFGKNTLCHLGSEAGKLGKRVLLVSGRQSARMSGVYARCLDSLSQSGLTCVEFAGVQSNPTLAKTHEGIELAKAEKVDLLCGVGGGSVLDTAKAIAAGCCADHDVWKFFIGKKSIRSALPVVCVSTMAASGSETNAGMVLTHEEKKQKLGFANRLLFPAVSIMDPETTYSVSHLQTACGVIDTVSHLLESWCSLPEKGCSLQRGLLAGIAGVMVEASKQALIQPNEYNARATLMWAASLALNGIVTAGAGKLSFPVHLLEHSLSALYGISHGAGLAALLPGWFRYCAEECPEMAIRTEKFLYALFAERLPENIQEMGLSTWIGWMRELSLPTSLSEIHVQLADLDMICQNALPAARIWRIHREYTESVLRKILRCCFE